MLSGGHLVHQVARELTASLDRQLAPFGLTAQQAGVLLRSAPQPASPKQLAPLLGTDTAGMTRLLDRLEAKGLVRRERHPQDRRSIVIGLTDDGKALLPRLPPIFGRVTTRLFAGFTGDETQQVAELLRRMLDNLRAAGSGADARVGAEQVPCRTEAGE